MPKQTCSIVLVFWIFFLISGTGFCTSPIQTAQKIIMLDPGHGGAQNGLRSPSGLTEKDITLNLTKKIAHILEDRYNVLMTRASDIHLSAKERMSLANQKKASLFLSIHLNHSEGPAAFLYYFGLSDTRQQEADQYKNTWSYSSLRHKTQSLEAAKQFARIFSTQLPGTKILTKEVPVIILEGAIMPALLIEPASISDLPAHPVELENSLNIYAQLISDCVDTYFNRL